MITLISWLIIKFTEQTIYTVITFLYSRRWKRTVSFQY